MFCPYIIVVIVSSHNNTQHNTYFNTKNIQESRNIIIKSFSLLTYTTTRPP